MTIWEYEQFHDDDELDYSEHTAKALYEITYIVNYEDYEGKIQVPYGEGNYCDIEWVYADTYLEAEVIAEELKEQKYGEVKICRKRG